MPDTRIVADRQIYEEVVSGEIPRAKDFVWLGTSDLKDLHVDSRGRMVPFLEVLAGRRTAVSRLPGWGGAVINR